MLFERNNFKTRHGMLSAEYNAVFNSLGFLNSRIAFKKTELFEN